MERANAGTSTAGAFAVNRTRCAGLHTRRSCVDCPPAGVRRFGRASSASRLVTGRHRNTDKAIGWSLEGRVYSCMRVHVLVLVHAFARESKKINSSSVLVGMAKNLMSMWSNNSHPERIIHPKTTSRTETRAV